MLVGCSVALADEPAKRPQPSTDDALRDSLDAHSGDDYDRAAGRAQKTRQRRKRSRNGSFR